MALRPIRGGTRTPSRPWAGVQPVYEDFRPMSEWQQDEESDILLLFLPGCFRQYLKVSTEGKNIVRVRGERLVAGNKWSRLQEDYQVPERCNIRAVRARFEGGILTITMPWKKNNQAQESSKEAAKATTSTEVPPKTISSPESQKQPMSPPKASLEPRPLKVADDIPTKVLNPPSITAGSTDKGKDVKTFSEPQTQKGRDEQRDQSPEPKTVTSTTSITDGVERKDISTEIKAKHTKLGTIEKSKQGTEDKKIIENISEEVVDDPAEKIARKIINEKEKLEKVEYTMQEEKPTTSKNVSSNIGYGLGNYKQTVKSLAELNEERQLLVNIGVAVLVIVVLGTYITYNIGSGEAKE